MGLGLYLVNYNLEPITVIFKLNLLGFSAEFLIRIYFCFSLSLNMVETYSSSYFLDPFDGLFDKYLKKYYMHGTLLNIGNAAVYKTDGIYSHGAYILIGMILYLNLYCIFISEVFMVSVV